MLRQLLVAVLDKVISFHHPGLNLRRAKVLIQ